MGMLGWERRMNEDWQTQWLMVSVEIPSSERAIFHQACRRLGLRYLPIRIWGIWRRIVTYCVIGGAGLDDLQQYVVAMAREGHRVAWRVEGFVPDLGKVWPSGKRPAE
jgi:hypothetical protein